MVDFETIGVILGFLLFLAGLAGFYYGVKNKIIISYNL